MILRIFFLTVFVLGDSYEEQPPVVKTQLGTVVGHYKQSHDGRLFSAFEGIPYAQPPIGRLRFDEPRAIEPWIGDWVADRIYTCIQLLPIGTVGSEDCLYINVYVPKLKPTPEYNLDVVAHIHGGAFLVAGPELAGPEFLMDRDIVYVNFNYRLGVLGFLSTEDGVIKGNMGLKDQAMALQWIQSNIKQFGGNPHSVTLTGLSAGATSAYFHYLSPQSKGLFHRGISQSGTATAPWAIQKAALNYTKLLAASVGCESAITRTTADCLRQRSAQQLIIKSQKDTEIFRESFIHMAPVVEVESESAFITEHPFKLLQQGKINDVPWITSITTEEGILGVASYITKFKYIEENWNYIAPQMLGYSYTCANAAKNNVSEMIKKYYFNGDPLSIASIHKFIKLFGDRHFTLDFEKSARIQSKVSKAPIYCYVYGYKEDSIEAEKNFSLEKNYGVNHGADGHLLYNMQLLGYNISGQNLTKSDAYIKNFLVDMVVSFSKTGKPVHENVVWHQTNSSKEFGYLFIKNPENITMVYQDEIAPKEFWESLDLKEDEKYNK